MSSSRISVSARLSIPYWRQGDSSFDEPEAMEERLKLRTHPRVLGVLEINSVNMFSNLRMQGGTNHLLGLPTSLLHQWRYTGTGHEDTVRPLATCIMRFALGHLTRDAQKAP